MGTLFLMKMTTLLFTYARLKLCAVIYWLTQRISMSSLLCTSSTVRPAMNTSTHYTIYQTIVGSVSDQALGWISVLLNPLVNIQKMYLDTQKNISNVSKISAHLIELLIIANYATFYWHECLLQTTNKYTELCDMPVSVSTPFFHREDWLFQLYQDSFFGNHSSCWTLIS